jgi:hypothetical protein
MSDERCSHLWVDIMEQTHVCDQPEGHLEAHYCHCGWVLKLGDDTQDVTHV